LWIRLFLFFCENVCIHSLRVHMFMIERIAAIKHSKDQKKRMLAA